MTGFIRVLYICDSLLDEPIFVTETNPDTVLDTISMIRHLSEGHAEKYIYRTIYSLDINTLNTLESLRKIREGEGNSGDFISLWYDDNAVGGITNV